MMHKPSTASQKPIQTTMTEEQYDEIHEYLLGQLNPQAQQKVAHQIKNDANYANSVVEERILIRAIQRNNREETKNRLRLLHQTHFGRGGSSFSMQKIWTAIVISLLLGIAAWFFFCIG